MGRAGVRTAFWRRRLRERGHLEDQGTSGKSY